MPVVVSEATNSCNAYTFASSMGRTPLRSGCSLETETLSKPVNTGEELVDPPHVYALAKKNLSLS